MDSKNEQPDPDEAALTVEELALQIMREAALGSASLDAQVVPRPTLDDPGASPSS